MTLEQRFWDKVDRAGPGDCWMWTASTQRNGYGEFSVAGKLVKAHRVAYELVVGPIPDGMQLDHLCRNRGCVNPAHLDPVTGVENVRRGKWGAMTTHCPQGHPYDAANTYVRPHTGHRECRTCRRDRKASA